MAVVGRPCLLMEEQGGRAEDSTVASEKREGEKRERDFFLGGVFLC